LPQLSSDLWDSMSEHRPIRANDRDLMQTFLVDSSARESRRAYQRIAPLYDLLDAPYERSWKRGLRAELFSHARGRILDVGVGTGCNMPHYPADSEVVGIDLSQRMLERAADRASGLRRSVPLAQMNLLELAFADHSFDTVVATFTLICLPTPLQLPALRELCRVCRPTGTVLILDYRLSSDPAVRLLMRCLSPWLRWAFAGRYASDPDGAIAGAGLRLAARRWHRRGAVTQLILEPARAPEL
jgi:phosphatidylethanolamine/phosphatidyl-N-methylethanolamine N-methyltransferase